MVIATAYNVHYLERYKYYMWISDQNLNFGHLKTNVLYFTPFVSQLEKKPKNNSCIMKNTGVMYQCNNLFFPSFLKQSENTSVDSLLHWKREAVLIMQLIPVIYCPVYITLQPLRPNISQPVKPVELNMHLLWLQSFSCQH